MTEFDKLAAALVAFQGDVPVIPKNRTAKIPTKSGGSYSYKYADLSDMWDAIRSPLNKHGLAVTQPLAKSERAGHIAIRTIVWHESGQRDESVVELSVVDKTPQEVGSAITYFKRYALGAALGISTDDDDDGGLASQRASSWPEVKEKAAQKAVQKRPVKSDADVKRDELREVAKHQGWKLTDVAKAYADSVSVDGKPGDLRTATADEVEAFIVSLETGVVTL